MTRVRLDRVAIEIRTTPQVRADLARLVATGFYGPSIEVAAEERLCTRSLFSR